MDWLWYRIINGSQYYGLFYAVDHTTLLISFFKP